MLAGQIIDQVNTLSVELRPALFDDLALLPSIVQYIKGFMEQTQLHVIFKHAGLEQRFPSRSKLRPSASCRNRSRTSRATPTRNR